MPSKRFQDSLNLAAELFDANCLQGIDAHEGNQASVPICCLERLLANVRERANELCGDSEGAQSCISPQNQRTIDREAFLATTHEVCRVVGPRIFNAAVQEELNAELCAMPRAGSSPRLRMKLRLTLSTDSFPIIPKYAMILTPSWRSRRPRPAPLDSDNLASESEHDQDALLDALLEAAAVASLPQAPINRFAGTLTGRDFFLAEKSPTQGQMPPGWPHLSETVIFFDWDDTLCPSSVLSKLGFNKSFFKAHNSLDRKEIGMQLQGALNKHSEVAQELLRASAAHGKVVVVTLAIQDWLQATIQQFLPSLGSVMEELGVEVIYARKSLPKHRLRNAVMDDLDLGVEMKKAAIIASLRKHQKMSSSRSILNLISIGDSLAERHALMDVTYSSWPSSVCKTIKLADEPQLESLTAELQQLGSYLQALINFPEDRNLDLDHVSLTGLTPLNKYSDCQSGGFEREGYANLVEVGR